MLRMFDRLEDMDFDSLMKVYREGNLENGKYFYPLESEDRQLALAECDFRKYLNNDFFSKPDACYWIWEESGTYISALRLESVRQGMLLEALETDPDCRCRGYAKKLLKTVLRALPQGRMIYSVVANDNIASLRTHRSCGFSTVPMPEDLKEIYNAEYYVTLAVTT